MKDKLAKIKDKLKAFFKEIQENFNNNFKPKLKAFFKKYLTKQVLTVIGIIIPIPVLIVSGIKVYNYSKTAYLKPYIEKYQIEYPEGILEEMCDPYGKDQSIRGKIEIEDLKFSKYVSNIITDDNAFLENGADVGKDQHFRAIRFNGKDVDLEGMYSTAQLFLKSSQSVKLTTLYNKEQYRVIAVYYTNTKPEDDRGYVFPYNFCGNMSEKDFEFFEDALSHKTLYDTGYEYSIDDYFLSISVPSDFMKDFRFVVVCVKTDKKGFEKSKTALPNEKIFFPQVWYDANHEDNPYKFTGKWHPKG